MTESALEIVQTGWCLDVTLNRPAARNAMNNAMVSELGELMESLPARTDIRALVLRGRGGTFCAGGDLRDMAGLAGAPDSARLIAEANREFGLMLQSASVIPQVLIAAVEGPAMGGGFGLVAVADIVIAGETASFGLPEVTLGLIPAQIAPFVARRIGLPATRRLALTGGRLDAATALAVGLVDQVTTDLEASVAATLDAVRKAAPGAVAATKALLNRLEPGGLSALLDRAAEQFASAALGPEAAAGLPAFLTRQPAPWAAPWAKAEL
jgi:isohexenylglutaconyl-CoA hydratase